MTYLLDTHVWLWMELSPERLGSVASTIIEEAGNELMLSAASAWEISIKQAMGRLPLPQAAETYVPERMRRNGVEGLPVQHAHALRAGSLPFHHRDPFDRLLIAQAQVENLPVITADPAFDAYDVEIIRA